MSLTPRRTGNPGACTTGSTTTGGRGHAVRVASSLFAAALLAQALVGCASGPTAGGGTTDDASGSAAMAAASATAIGNRHAKNVIVMIADGCGEEMIRAADDYENGGARQAYESFPVSALMSTYPIHASYDPTAAAKDAAYLDEHVTDSAAAATAMGTGLKTFPGVIGMTGEDSATLAPVENIMERAQSLGKATGVVTTVPWSDATPAGFTAHQRDRDAMTDIADQMVRGKLAVIMGAGDPYSTDDGTPLTPPHFGFVGGEETWQAVSAGTIRADVDGDGKPDAWTLLRTRDQFQKLATGATPKRVLGTFQAAHTAQQQRGGDARAAAFAVPLNPHVPTLAEMSLGALNVLDNDPDGYVVMIEGGAVDDAEHVNEAGRAIEEEIDFDRAVAAVVARVDKAGAWKDTLLVVTADHETGHITGPRPLIGTAQAHVTNNGKGRMPGLTFNSKGHTNSLVPIFATGSAAGVVGALATGRDPVRGPYLDNAALGGALMDVLR
jgi:alkaline phosphatase